MTYRFVGTESQIGDLALNEFGQQVDLPEEVAAEAIRGGAALIPGEDFEDLGFTESELEQVKWPGGRNIAEPGTMAKVRAAWALCSKGVK